MDQARPRDTNGRMDGHTDKPTDGQVDRQIGRQTDRRTGRQADGPPDLDFEGADGKFVQRDGERENDLICQDHRLVQRRLTHRDTETR